MKIQNVEMAHQVFRKKIRLDVEELWIAALTSRLEIIALEMIFRGTVNHCMSHPRDIARFVCLKNSSFFMMSHSHPSGESNPSIQDIRMTKQILKLSELIEVPLLDHIIISEKNYTSLAGRDFFKNFAAKRVAFNAQMKNSSQSEFEIY